VPDSTSRRDASNSSFSTLPVAEHVRKIGGRRGLGLISLYVETAGFTVLDLVAKVGFGIILLSSRDVLDAAGSTTAQPAD